MKTNEITLNFAKKEIVKHIKSKKSIEALRRSLKYAICFLDVNFEGDNCDNCFYLLESGLCSNPSNKDNTCDLKNCELI